MADEETPRCAYGWCQNDHTDPNEADQHFEVLPINALVSGRLSLFDGNPRSREMTATIDVEALTDPLDEADILELRDGLSQLVRSYQGLLPARGFRYLPTLRRALPWEDA